MYFFSAILLLIITFYASRKDIKYKKFLIITNAAISIVYIVWRITTIPTHGVINFMMGFLLFVAELLGLTQFWIFEYLFMRKYILEKKTIKDFEEIPAIDVLICTYNEPISLLEKTIIASLNMKYPQEKLKIYMCDDGHRDSLKRICDKYEIGYITRESNEGAKAGNINNALKKIKGELFVVLDADMIPCESFLEKTAGYFSQDEVAFVQTPQVYYNQDMYQYNLKLSIPNEQDFFMRDVQEARAAINAVLHVGTNAVFRRKYVDEIGGYPTSSITEDMAVGMLLQDKGYKTIFINEVLVLGLSATNYGELVKQRDRWCRGNLQVMKQFNPISRKGLSFAQKIAYVDGVIYWFSSIQKMIYIICPIIYLFTSVIIIEANIVDIVKYFIPFFLGEFFVFNVLSSKTRELKWAHFYEVAMAPYISFSIIREMFSLKTGFNVTSKDTVNEKSYFQLSLAMPYIIISCVSIASWVCGLIFLKYNIISSGAYLINMIWSIYNFIGTIVCLRAAYQKPVFRKGERAKVSEEIFVNINYDDKEIKESMIYDISEAGMGISCKNNDMKLGTKINIKFTYKNRKTNVEGTIVRAVKDFIGVKFDENINIEDKKNIVRIYVNNLKPYYEINKEQVYIERFN